MLKPGKLLIASRLNVVSPIKISSLLLLTVISLAAVMAAGCTGAGSGTTPTTLPTTSDDAVVLTVTGSVGNQLQLKSSDLDTFPAVPVNLSDMRSDRNANQSGGPPVVVTNGNGGTMARGANGGLPSGAGSNQVGPDGTTTVIGRGGSMAGSAGNGRVTGDIDATGISLNALLDLANPTAGATNVTFVGMGDRVEVIPLSEIRASAGAVMVRMGPGMFVAFIPGAAQHQTLSGLTGIVVS